MKKNILKNLALGLMLLFAASPFAQDEAVPFAVADKAPAYPGCENLSGEALQDCTSQKIINFVNSNFDTSLGKKLGIVGSTRIVVQFKIDADGNTTDVRSRSLDKDATVRERLQTEANRVVEKLPNMKPAEKEGKKVTILYSLPIQFEVPKTTEEKN
ncbi:MAG: energy transducer TonB [Christiangramia sp.]|uniref:energy transducer TonB n=1 Tax=Christiangramia sp. TaxID=1931228 RepID=UPI0032426EAF